jgi:hypothetical protein
MRFTRSVPASQWLRDQIDPPTSRRVSLREAAEKPWALGAFFLILLGLAVVMYISEPTFLESWGPKDAAEALGLTWQVQTSIAAIAFAGLALIIQLATDSPIAVRSSREVLHRETRFNLLVTYAGASSVTLGVVAIWLPSAGGTLLGVLICLVGTLGLIGLSYFRAAQLFLDERRALDKAIQLLLSRLDGEVRGQRTASAINQRLAQFFPKAGPVRRTRVAPAGRKTLPLVIVTEAQRVHDFDVVALRRVGVDLLRAVSGETFKSVEDPTGTPAEAAPEPAILLIRYQVNDVVQPGDALFQVVVGNEPKPNVLRSFDQRLRRCVNWSADTAVDDELARLKDSLLVAAYAGTSGALERGLRVYADLFRRILQTGGGPDNFPYGTYGPYWRAMQRSLREVAAVVIDKLGGVGVVLVSDNAYTLCKVAFETHEIDAMQEFLGLYPAYLRHVTAAPGSLSPEHLLVSLQNFLDFWLPALISDDSRLQEAVEIAAAAVIADTLKVCVDHGDASLVERVLAYFRYPTGARGRSEHSRVARTAAPLAALAWAFFRWKHDGQHAGLKAVCDHLLNAFTGKDLWSAYVWAVTASETGVPWDRWETERSLPLQFRFMQFHSFLSAAAVAIGSRVGMTVPDDPAPSDADRAQALLSAFDLADDLTSQLDLSAGSWREQLHASLTALIDRRKTTDDVELREAPLQDDRIEQFVHGFTESLAAATDRLSEVLLARPGDEATVDGTKLIVNQLVPRDFFVTRDRVSADPAELGRSLAEALVDGENAYLVKTLAAGHERIRADTEEVARRLALPRTYVVVVNDWDLAQQLGLNGSFPYSGEKQGVFLTIDDVEEMTVVCTLTDSARLRRTPVRDNRIGALDREPADVALAVRDYDQPTDQPVVHLMIGTSLYWTSTPGAGIDILIR